jgi:hypothetical protein
MPRQTILPASSLTHIAVRLPATSSPANILIAALHSLFANQKPKASPLSPESSNLMYGMYKTLFRKAAGRSVEALWSRIGELLDRFPRDQCENYFKAAGYGPT